MIDAEAVDPDFALIGLQKADDVFDRHRLAGSRVADDDHGLAFVDLKRETAEHLLGPESLVDVLQLDHGITNVPPKCGEDRRSAPCTARKGRPIVGRPFHCAYPAQPTSLLGGEAGKGTTHIAFAEALEGTITQLTHALAGDPEHGANFLERMLTSAFETEVQSEDLGVARRQRG